MTRYEEYVALSKTLTQQEIANKFGVTRQAVQKGIKFVTNPDFRKKIMKAKNKSQKERYKTDKSFREKTRKYRNESNRKKREG